MSNEIATTPKRRKGGQPGNLNGLKHGFYSRNFATMELKDLDAMLENGLDSEIRMLRVSIRRLFELTKENEDVEIGIRLVTVLGNTASRLANLLRTEALLGGSRELSIYNQLVMAIEVVAKETMGDE